MASNYDIFTPFPCDIDFKNEDGNIDFEIHQMQTPTLIFFLKNDGYDIDSSQYKIELSVHNEKYNVDYIQTNINITKEVGKVTIKCTNDISKYGGLCKGVIRFWKDDDVYAFSRVFTMNVIPHPIDPNGDGKPAESTLTQLEILLGSIDLVDGLIERFNKVIEDATVKITELNTTITTANNSDSKLKATIADSLIKTDILKQTVDDSVDKNAELNATIDNSKSANDKLNNTITTGQSILNQITNKNNEAIKTKSELDASIAEADEKLEEFKNFDTEQIVEKSNKIYAEMFAEYELCTVEHRLNCTPHVQLLLNSGAFGKGGFGLVPFGGSSDCSYGTYRIRYISNSKFIIIVSKNYFYDNAIVTRDTDYEYTINFNGNDNISMKVQLYSLPNDTSIYLGDENENYLIDEQGRYILG